MNANTTTTSNASTDIRKLRIVLYSPTVWTVENLERRCRQLRQQRNFSELRQARDAARQLQTRLRDLGRPDRLQFRAFARPAFSTRDWLSAIRFGHV